MTNELPITPVNMHVHTHFSFNALGLSPTDLIGDVARRGLYGVGICDFDVLDGLEEFYAAADRAEVRAAAGMETRVFFPEYGNQVINSPGEPGVYYFMGMGFAAVPGECTVAGRKLAELRTRSGARNRALIGRINAALPDIAIDYERDATPLTPSGNATERHIVAAYVARLRNGNGSPEMWRRATGLDGAKLTAALADDVALNNAVRNSLMKSGGVGYVQPGADTFPPIDDVIAMILDARAMPMATWLNGLSEGEMNMAAQLECLRAKGVVALNIIPDRNWNIKDAQERETKVARLHEVVAIARRMDIPLNVGTELNAPGQPMVDDFSSEPMRPLWADFLRGANTVIGHTVMLRFADFSYCGPDAEGEFGGDTKRKNAFFESVGKLPPAGERQRKDLLAMGAKAAYVRIRDAAKKYE